LSRSWSVSVSQGETRHSLIGRARRAAEVKAPSMSPQTACTMARRAGKFWRRLVLSSPRPWCTLGTECIELMLRYNEIVVNGIESAIPSLPTKRDSQRGGTSSADAPGAFGHRLRQWRMDRDLTLRDVSEKSGLSIAYLSDLERGKLANPTLETLTALAGALGLSLNMLLGLEDDQTSSPPVSTPLEELRGMSAFRSAVAAQAALWRVSESEVEQGWIDSLASIRVARRSPRTASDYLFIFEAARRALD
jgi:XRE family transcriptional regulator, regulator of sulfur utilization